jgi:2-keto-4-pentenoate hydratase
MANDLEELAHRQWRDYLAREPGTCFSDPGFVLDLARAYAVQDAVAKLRVSGGDRVIGYKIGCAGPGTMQQFGMEGPIRGCLFESEIRRHHDAVNFADFASLAIEGEMAVRIAPDSAIETVFPIVVE